MRKFTALLIIFISTKLFCQDFAPVGAIWHYTERFAFSGDISYLTIEAVKDTIVKGKNCRLLKKNGGLFCAYNVAQDYVYTEDSAAYFYVNKNDSFQKLYDLKAIKDSSWTIVFENEFEQKLDTVLVNVDSVGSVQINNNVLIRFFVIYSLINSGFDGFSYRSEIVERIGDVNYLFNLNTLFTMVCDANYSGGLRCYQDNQLGFYSTNIADSCTYTYEWIGIDQKSSEGSFDIFPNPTAGFINIRTDLETNFKVEFYDIFGCKKYVNEFNSNAQIDLSEFSKGLYILTITDESKALKIKKIVKN